MTGLPAQPNRSTLLAFECLHAVVAAGGPVGSRALARQLGLEPTRINRLLQTLAHVGLLTRTPDRKYRPGPGIHALAAISLQGSHLLQSALPHARRWWERGFTLTLGVLWRQYLCYLLHARPDRPFEQAVGGHELMVAPYSSAGLILLAHRPPEEAAAWAFEPWERLVEPLAELPAQLAAARAQGYALRHYRDGVISLGVPVGRPPVAGLAISRPGLSEGELPGLIEELTRDAAALGADA